MRGLGAPRLGKAWIYSVCLSKKGQTAPLQNPWLQLIPYQYEVTSAGEGKIKRSPEFLCFAPLPVPLMTPQLFTALAFVAPSTLECEHSFACTSASYQPPTRKPPAPPPSQSNQQWCIFRARSHCFPFQSNSGLSEETIMQSFHTKLRPNLSPIHCRWLINAPLHVTLTPRGSTLLQCIAINKAPALCTTRSGNSAGQL